MAANPAYGLGNQMKRQRLYGPVYKLQYGPAILDTLEVVSNHPAYIIDLTKSGLRC